MSYILGLTGGIASGKSTVSQLFKEQGLPVVDADIGAREVMQQGKPAYQKVKQTFGESILLPDGSLDRKALGRLIFNDKKKREQLDAIVQADIREWILSKCDRLTREGHAIIILDIPLLFEAGYDEEMDDIMVVSLSRCTQLKRLISRDHLTNEEANARIDSQMPLKEKTKRADIVIDNNGTIEETQKQVLKWLDGKGYYK